MTEVPFCFEAHGSIRKERTYQTTRVTIDGNIHNKRRVQIQYPYHVPSNPNSDGQKAQRLKFKNGAAAWTALSPGEREAWNLQAAEELKARTRKPGSWRPHTGYNLFMSEYLNSH